MVTLTEEPFQRPHPKIKYRPLMLVEPYSDPFLAYEFYIFKRPLPFMKPCWLWAITSDETEKAIEHCKGMLPGHRKTMFQRLISILNLNSNGSKLKNRVDTPHR